MPPNLEERRPAITPQLAVRVAVLGGFAFVLFAVIFFRLWFLQVLSGDDYVTQARENRVRKIKIEAPRGDIVDRDGNRLVRTRVAPVVQIVPSGLPEAEIQVADAYRKARSASEMRRLAAADQLRSLERRRREEERRYTKPERREHRRLARAARRAAAGRGAAAAGRGEEPAPLVPPPRARARHVAAHDPAPRDRGHRRGAVLERDDQDRRPACRLQLPQGAQGRVPRRRRREAVPARLPAQGAGRPAVRHAARDLAGRAEEEEVPRRRARHAHRRRRHRGDLRPLPARPGRLHPRRHQRARQPRRPPRGHPPRAAAGPAPAPDARPRPPARRQQRAQDRRSPPPTATATRPRRAPTWRWTRPTARCSRSAPIPRFDANVFAKPLSQERFDKLNSEENGAPLFNRAIAAAYPTGSVFKPITAMASLEEGILTPTQTIFDDGEFKLGPQTFKNARDARYGLLNLSQALKVSSDVFFYTLGERANSRGPIIQKWARKLGLGHKTGHRHPRRVRRPAARPQVARRRLRQVPEVRQAREGAGPDVRGAAEVRRHRAAVVHGRQRQPRGRPGRPAGDAAADGDRLLGDRQRRARRASRTWR